MNKTIASSIVLAFAALAGGQAMAAHIDPVSGINLDQLRAAMDAPSSVTRAQVKADLFVERAANKNQHIDPITGINLSKLARDMAQPIVKTRAQVREETANALKTPKAMPSWEILSFGGV